jgi:hypothetical protein
MLSDKVKNLFQQMYELTEPECRLTCRCPQSCCSPEYCDFAEEFAREHGETLQATNHPRLKFMGEKGCIIPPHLRPLCTLHTCDIGNLGFHRSDPKWTKKYFELREQIEKELANEN